MDNKIIQIEYKTLKNMVDRCVGRSIFGLSINSELFYNLFYSEVTNKGIDPNNSGVSLNKKYNCITVIEI